MSVDAEQERLRFEGDLDKWMKMLGAGITGFQPEAYALMDLAVEELVKLRAVRQDGVAITDEMVERAAHALEKRRMQDQYGWSDELFEVWWNEDSRFITKRHVWGFFEGTQKERCLWEARIALEAALGASHSASIPT